MNGYDRDMGVRIRNPQSAIRNLRRYPYLLSLLYLLLISPGFPRAEAPYIWPLEADRAITSSFGEYRPGHLHAGVDMKTWGQTGLKARAVADGYVSRIRTSPGGYGKAIYLKLQDGQVAVYAHLSDFATKLRREVERAQDVRGRYTVDVFFEPDRFPVVKGEVIGRSGRSGTKAPHLHFELRDSEGRPTNPLHNGIEVEDTRAPRMNALALIPLGAGASVEGAGEALLLPLVRRKGTSAYMVSRRPRVSGTIGLAVSTYDQADGAYNRLAPYRLRLAVDGKEAFECRYDRFSYDNTHKVDLDRNFGLRRKGHDLFHNLFLAEGNDLPFYRGRGILDDLSPGMHRIAVEAEDVQGNVASATIEVLVDVRPKISTFDARREKDLALLTVRAADPDDAVLLLQVERSVDEGETWEEVLRDSLSAGEETRSLSIPLDPDRLTVLRATVTDRWAVRSLPRTRAFPAGTFDPSDHPAPILRCAGMFGPNTLQLAVESSEVLAVPPIVHFARPGDPPTEIPLEQTGLTSYLVAVELLPGRDGPTGLELEATTPYGRKGWCTFEFIQRSVTRSGGGSVETPDGEARAAFTPGSVYETLYPRILPFDPGPVEHLSPVRAGYAFEPSDVPFDRSATILLRYPQDFPNPEKLAVYAVDEKEAYKFMGNAIDRSSRTVSAQVRHFSSYALLLDEIAPVISDLHPGEGARTRRRRPVLSAHIQDFGSGIGGEEDIIVRLDSQRLISEYDPPMDAVRYPVRHPLAPGTHRLEVIVRDRCGNEASAVSRFVVE